MSLNNLVKRLQDIMRNDAGINGDAQRIEQMVWIIFLKIFNYKEEQWEAVYDDYESVIPDNLKWNNWAFDNKDGKALTGDELLSFVNTELFPSLKKLEIDNNSSMVKSIVKSAFEDNNNYMKDGILLRQVINVINEIDFEDYKERHAFGEIYETILRSLQSAGNAGEFYTPRAVTDFIIKMINPKLGERMADFACGTGGFLTSALNLVYDDVKNADKRELYNNFVYGIEKKALPFLLCITNMFIHDVDRPNIFHDNALEYCKKAQEIYENFGEKSANVAACYNSMGLTYFYKKEYSKALEYYKKAIDMFHTIHLDTQPNTAVCYLNMGQATLLLGQEEEAATYFKKSQEINIAVFGKEHPTVATFDNYIKQIYASATNKKQHNSTIRSLFKKLFNG